MTPRMLAAAALIAGATLSACSSDDKAPSGANTALAPAHEVDAGKAVELGEFVDLGLGVQVQVSAGKVGGDDSGPWLEVPARVENSGDAEAYVPEFSIHCSNTSEGGGTQVGSTIDITRQIPAGAFVEGVLNLLRPTDARTGEPASDCVSPAYIEVELQGVVPDGAVPGRWALDAETVTALNAGVVK